MRQSELEKFVDELATAEKQAAMKLDEASKAWEERLVARKLELDKEKLEKLDELKKEFLNDEKKLKAEMLRYRKAAELQTDKRIEELQKTHDLKTGQLVNWLIKQVMNP